MLLAGVVQLAMDHRKGDRGHTGATLAVCGFGLLLMFAPPLFAIAVPFLSMFAPAQLGVGALVLAALIVVPGLLVSSRPR